MRESVERLEQDVIMDIQDTIGNPLLASFLSPPGAVTTEQGFPQRPALLCAALLAPTAPFSIGEQAPRTAAALLPSQLERQSA